MHHNEAVILEELQALRDAYAIQLPEKKAADFSSKREGPFTVRS